MVTPWTPAPPPDADGWPPYKDFIPPDFEPGPVVKTAFPPPDCDGRPMLASPTVEELRRIHRLFSDGMKPRTWRQECEAFRAVLWEAFAPLLVPTLARCLRSPRWRRFPAKRWRWPIRLRERCVTWQEQQQDREEREAMKMLHRRMQQDAARACEQLVETIRANLGGLPTAGDAWGAMVLAGGGQYTPLNGATTPPPPPEGGRGSIPSPGKKRQAKRVCNRCGLHYHGPVLCPTCGSSAREPRPTDPDYFA